jgi:hypothetical protein
MESYYPPIAVTDCFHIYSNGKKVNLLFSSREEKIFMMNLLAITSYSCSVKLLVHQILDTHFHLIVAGKVSSCARFRNVLLIKMIKFIKQKGSRAYSNGDFEVSMSPINEATELKNKFMYVYRNAIVADFKLMPWEYEWGPGNIYFVDHSALSNIGRPLVDFTYNAQMKMFHSKVKLPADWRVNEEGMILPHSYIDWRRVEDMFGRSRVFLAFLHQGKDKIVSMNPYDAFKAKEADLRKEAEELCMNIFNCKLKGASLEQRIAIAKKEWGDRRTFSLPLLSRIILIDETVLRNILEP